MALTGLRTWQLIGGIMFVLSGILILTFPIDFMNTETGLLFLGVGVVMVVVLWLRG